ncbi:MAG: hypothetical protein ISR65_16765 [Bacteriovoracaceae bacterium]|nr:hypothetical protein [Bacteriovoracaceae bacterium]
MKVHNYLLHIVFTIFLFFSHVLYAKEKWDPAKNKQAEIELFASCFAVMHSAEFESKKPKKAKSKKVSEDVKKLAHDCDKFLTSLSDINTGLFNFGQLNLEYTGMLAGTGEHLGAQHNTANMYAKGAKHFLARTQAADSMKRQFSSFCRDIKAKSIERDNDLTNIKVIQNQMQDLSKSLMNCSKQVHQQLLDKNEHYTKIAKDKSARMKNRRLGGRGSEYNKLKREKIRAQNLAKAALEQAQHEEKAILDKLAETKPGEGFIGKVKRIRNKINLADRRILRKKGPKTIKERYKKYDKFFKKNLKRFKKIKKVWASFKKNITPELNIYQPHLYKPPGKKAYRSADRLSRPGESGCHKYAKDIDQVLKDYDKAIKKIKKQNKEVLVKSLKKIKGVDKYRTSYNMQLEMEDWGKVFQEAKRIYTKEFDTKLLHPKTRAEFWCQYEQQAGVMASVELESAKKYVHRQKTMQEMMKQRQGATALTGDTPQEQVPRGEPSQAVKDLHRRYKRAQRQYEEADRELDTNGMFTSDDPAIKKKRAALDELNKVRALSQQMSDSPAGNEQLAEIENGVTATYKKQIEKVQEKTGLFARSEIKATPGFGNRAFEAGKGYVFGTPIDAGAQVDVGRRELGSAGDLLPEGTVVKGEVQAQYTKGEGTHIRAAFSTAPQEDAAPMKPGFMENRKRVIPGTDGTKLPEGPGIHVALDAKTYIPGDPLSDARQSYHENRILRQKAATGSYGGKDREYYTDQMNASRQQFYRLASSGDEAGKASKKRMDLLLENEVIPMGATFKASMNEQGVDGQVHGKAKWNGVVHYWTGERGLTLDDSTRVDVKGQGSESGTQGSGSFRNPYAQGDFNYSADFKKDTAKVRGTVVHNGVEMPISGDGYVDKQGVVHTSFKGGTGGRSGSATISYDRATDVANVGVNADVDGYRVEGKGKVAIGAKVISEGQVTVSNEEGRLELTNVRGSSQGPMQADLEGHARGVEVGGSVRLNQDRTGHFDIEGQKRSEGYKFKAKADVDINEQTVNNGRLELRNHEGEVVATQVQGQLGGDKSAKLEGQWKGVRAKGQATVHADQTADVRLKGSDRGATFNLTGAVDGKDRAGRFKGDATYGQARMQLQEGIGSSDVASGRVSGQYNDLVRLKDGTIVARPRERSAQFAGSGRFLENGRFVAAGGAQSTKGGVTGSVGVSGQMDGFGGSGRATRNKNGSTDFVVTGNDREENLYYRAQGNLNKKGNATGTFVASESQAQGGGHYRGNFQTLTNQNNQSSTAIDVNSGRTKALGTTLETQNAFAGIGPDGKKMVVADEITFGGYKLPRGFAGVVKRNPDGTHTITGGVVTTDGTYKKNFRDTFLKDPQKAAQLIPQEGSIVVNDPGNLSTWEKTKLASKIGWSGISRRWEKAKIAGKNGLAGISRGWNKYVSPHIGVRDYTSQAHAALPARPARPVAANNRNTGFDNAPATVPAPRQIVAPSSTRVPATTAPSRPVARTATQAPPNRLSYQTVQPRHRYGRTYDRNSYQRVRPMRRRTYTMGVPYPTAKPKRRGTK